MSKTENKRQILKNQVVELVRKFIKSNGGINAYDLEALFGPISPICECNEVASALATLPVEI